MALIRWDPARELGSLQDEMNRLFNTFFDSSSAGAGQPAGRWMPAMDLVEREHEYTLHADLPGLSEGDVNIELEDNVLTISGKRTSQHEDRKAGYYRLERGTGSFRRSLTLPEGVDPQAITARFDRGVLEVSIPKPAQRVPHKVSIAVGGNQPQTIEASESAPGSAPGGSEQSQASSAEANSGNPVTA
jgi:HSP20 family protein